MTTAAEILGVLAVFLLAGTGIGIALTRDRRSKAMTHKANARQRPDGTWEPACRCGCIANHVPAGAYPHDNATDAVEHAQQLLHDAEHGPAL